MENRVMRLELKYCERCGGLWLRPKGSDLIFCAGCAKAMAGLMLLRQHSLQSVAVQPANEQTEAQEAFWAEGGNA